MNTINENRPGYKKTKVGWIPEEWDVRMTRNLVEYLGGNAFKSTDSVPEGVK